MQISLTLRNLKQPNASSYSIVHFNATFPNFHMSEHNLTMPLDVLVIKIMTKLKRVLHIFFSLQLLTNFEEEEEFQNNV